jgi:hypothetical protein
VNGYGFVRALIAAGTVDQLPALAVSFFQASYPPSST